MKQRYKQIIMLAAALLLCGCTQRNDAVSSEMPAETSLPQAETVYIREETLGCNYYNERDFDLYISRAEQYETDGEVLCGTIPHHLTAGHMAAGFFKTAAMTRPETETVVIISTLHYPAKAPVITSPLDWSTPFGRLSADRDIIDRFISELGAAEDSKTVEYDHSSSAVIPFVKHYFPEAKTACLLVGSSADKDISKDISELLLKISEEKKCLFVFSVDFSHYLEPNETDRHDEQTRNAVLSGDLASINKMTDANVDSYRCLGAFVRLSEGLGAEIRELDHSNSMEISEIPYDKVSYSEGLTSYFIFAGTKEKN
ncbi:MAG: AmmeMemoRadiSam system protein B [Oscillospiraceae bacterium]|nr:AmmeMemoRadiSam system protein B [Oscillospiraceae bacterium]